MIKYSSLILIVILIYLNHDLAAQSDRYYNIDQLFKASKFTEALGNLDSIEKIGNNSSTSIFAYYKVSCFLSLKRTEEALRICSDKISKLDNKDTVLHKLYFIRSFAYKDLGKPESEIQDINKAIELKPTEISYYLNASYFYGENSEYDKCFSALEKAIKLNPNDVYILNNLSYYSSMIKQYDKAIYYANEGIKYTTDKNWIGSLLNNRGFAALGLNKYETALTDINESIKLFPTNSYAFYNKALVYIQLGDKGKICENLELAKKYGAINMTRDLISKYCKK